MNRRDFLRASSLLAVGSTVVPEFLAGTALAAEPAADATKNVLVVLELTGGNDGLNTVIPYADDLYHKNRPTLRQTKSQVLRLDDHLGLNSSMGLLHQMWQQQQLAVVENVGYPNPDRSHFESMDIWQLGDPARSQQQGWIARSVPGLFDATGSVPALYVGADRLPVALNGAAGGVLSLNDKQPVRLELQGTVERQQARRKLLDDLTGNPDKDQGLSAFVRRRQVQAYTSLQKLEEMLKDEQKNDERRFNRGEVGAGQGDLGRQMGLIGRLINKGFGSRVYYVSRDGFDTHSDQAKPHGDLLADVSAGIDILFQALRQSNNTERVLVLTYSEFGRRVKENGSRGTDHGAGSCLFVAGPAASGTVVGGVPRLDDLDSGDVRFKVDFRQVYATLLDQWLGVDSTTVLGPTKFEHVPILKAKKA